MNLFVFMRVVVFFLLPVLPVMGFVFSSQKSNGYGPNQHELHQETVKACAVSRAEDDLSIELSPLRAGITHYLLLNPHGILLKLINFFLESFFLSFFFYFFLLSIQMHFHRRLFFLLL
jgi:hypothetical protein